MFLQVFLFLFPLYLAEQKPGICLCPDPRPMAGAGQRSRILEDQSPHQESMHLFLLDSGPPEGWMHADDLGTGPCGCGFHGVEGKPVSPGILNMWPGGGWDREELVSLCLSACLSDFHLDRTVWKAKHVFFLSLFFLLHLLFWCFRSSRPIRHFSVVNLAMGIRPQAALVRGVGRKQHQSCCGRTIVVGVVASAFPEVRRFFTM